MTCIGLPSETKLFICYHLPNQTLFIVPRLAQTILAGKLEWQKRNPSQILVGSSACGFSSRRSRCVVVLAFRLDELLNTDDGQVRWQRCGGGHAFKL